MYVSDVNSDDMSIFRSGIDDADTSLNRDRMLDFSEAYEAVC